jgi:hypothetical protein
LGPWDNSGTKDWSNEQARADRMAPGASPAL